MPEPHIPLRDLKPHEGRVKDFLISEGYCHEKLTPDCVQDAIDDLNEEYVNKCESPDQNSDCRHIFDMLAALERTYVFLQKYAKG